jgi:hypothetical protein
LKFFIFYFHDDSLAFEFPLEWAVKIGQEELLVSTVIVISFLFLVLSAYFTRGKINNTNRWALLGKKSPAGGGGMCCTLKRGGGQGLLWGLSLGWENRRGGVHEERPHRQSLSFWSSIQFLNIQAKTL